ncbi:MAG TPA: MgtC/SapB family protein [Polyangia bacterium]|nr:MgtC/SapB family protein [Polyangia bacterium]
MSAAVMGEILLRLVLAVSLGGALGMERSYHGRPAGFRTHALVGLASASLMLISTFESVWFHVPDGARATIDPTRMAQGLMTGIGFLGAGVIMRHGPTVRGLTTAASIWITAGIGILVGIGFYVAAGLTAGIALAALSGFRWIERNVRSESYADFSVTFAADGAPHHSDVIALARHHGLAAHNLTQHFRRSDGTMEYGMTVHSVDKKAFTKFAEALRARGDVVEFRIAPTGD